MTINEIAKLAGVSKAAVSRYLNDGPISEEKKKKIHEVIEKTGYRPSAQAQMLRTGKTGLIGVVLPKINSEAMSRVVAGISTVLSRQGYQMLLANTENKVEKELEYLKLFQQNPVEGILFIATIFNRDHKIFFQENTIPLVVIGQKTDMASCVYHDDFGAARELTRLFIQNGRKGIGYIGVTAKDKAAGLNRMRGYRRALEEEGIPLREEYMAEGNFSMEAGYEKMKSLLDRGIPIDGVFCATDSIAVGAMNYLKERKIGIPHDMGIAGIGHTQMSCVISPRLTTAHYYYKTSGMEAANLVLGMIRGEKNRMTQIKLGFEIVKAESL